MTAVLFTGKACIYRDRKLLFPIALRPLAISSAELLRKYCRLSSRQETPQQ